MEPALLPPLREELILHPGPCGQDGAPGWTLHDPSGNRFYRLTWPVFEVLSRWSLGYPEAIARAVSADTTLSLTAGDVQEVARFLAGNQLLRSTTAADVGRLLALHDAGATGWMRWLLHHYLFFRVPLLRPDRFLDVLLPLVRWLGSRGFRLATLAALLGGLFLVGRQGERFAATFVDHLSVDGLVLFGLALGAAKILHELGHALTAKAYGLRVPTMGVAFLVLMPVLYTDVNEVWTLRRRRQRLMVGGAGILAELTLAVWATLAWGVLPDGPARGIAFTLAATTWISSLLINLSPFMRFDGYFLLMDALDLPNLHSRSFALARWHLREVLFSLGEPAPERMSAGMRAGLILFAWAVWLYRLILFLGIALLVYHFFIKVLGVILFVVEIGWFVLRPVLLEIREWFGRRGVIGARRRGRGPFVVAVFLLLVAVIPWSTRVSAPALLKAREHVVLYAPVPGVLAEIAVRAGDAVAAGAVLAHIEAPDVALRLYQAERRLAVARYELEAVGFEPAFRSRAQVLARSLEAAAAERSALLRDQARLILTAPVSGTVVDVSPLILPGQWINPREPLLGLRSGSQIEAYVTEEDLPRIRIGAQAVFIPEGTHRRQTAVITAIDHTAVKSLSDPQLAVPYGGPVPARFDSRALVPEGALYRVRLTPEDGTVPVPLRGQVHIDGDRRSLLGRAFRSVAAVLIREWSP